MADRRIFAVPRRGERITYHERPEWRAVQRMLPEDLRLTPDRMPHEEWWEWRGHSIHLDRYPVAGARATVVLLHGGGGNGRVLSPFAVMARRNGLEVVAPDMPGYGLTVRERGLHPSYALWTEVAADLIAAERARGATTVIVWGLSIGGMLAYLAAARSGSADAVIATTLADTRRLEVMAGIARAPWLGVGGAILARLLGRLIDPIVVPIGWLAPMDLIANDHEVSMALARDRTAGGSRVRLGFLRSLMRIRPAVEPAQFTGCPLLLAHPSLDPWTPVALSRPFFDRIAGEKRLVMLEGCGHLPIEEPGRHQLEQALVELVDRVT